MNILNIAGYKFLPLTDIDSLKELFSGQCLKHELKGTILLSLEGININLAGIETNIQAFQNFLRSDERFADMNFHETRSEKIPFKFLKVKHKPEIITLRQPQVDATAQRAPSVTPLEFKQWLDEERPLTILDTRNDYEMRFGAFSNALNLQLQDFSELPEHIDKIDRNKPIVMYCTGGIRCEKAALHLLDNGFTDVYQLDRGILGYFADVGGAHYEGECFVFDERISVDTNLQTTDTVQCKKCQGPVFADVGSCSECVSSQCHI